MSSSTKEEDIRDVERTFGHTLSGTLSDGSDNDKSQVIDLTKIIGVAAIFNAYASLQVYLFSYKKNLTRYLRFTFTDFGVSC